MARSVSWIDPEEVARLIAAPPDSGRARVPSRAPRGSATRPSAPVTRPPPSAAPTPDAPVAPSPARAAPRPPSPMRPVVAVPRIDPEHDVSERLDAIVAYVRAAFAPTALWIVDRDGLSLIPSAGGNPAIPVLAVVLRATMTQAGRHIGAADATQVELESGTHVSTRWVTTRRGDVAIVLTHDRPIDLDATRVVSDPLVQALA